MFAFRIGDHEAHVLSFAVLLQVVTTDTEPNKFQDM